MKPVEVLLVEDNAGDILLIRQALKEEPFRTNIRVAMDGEQAIQMLAARQFDPDLVILDLSIPKVSGLALLERIQGGVPVVVFTSSTSPQDRRRSFELGAKEFVQKPTEPKAYVGLVSQIVRNWASPKGNAGAAS